MVCSYLQYIGNEVQVLVWSLVELKWICSLFRGDVNDVVLVEVLVFCQENIGFDFFVIFDLLGVVFLVSVGQMFGDFYVDLLIIRDVLLIGKLWVGLELLMFEKMLWLDGELFGWV